MDYRKLGTSDLKVSEISLGCWTMGGLNWVDGKPNGWANVDEDEIAEAVKAAVDAGVNHFDNADVYGNGRAERMLRRVLRRLGLKSEDFVIATKMGHFKGTAGHAYEPVHIRHQCEQSLINLGRDYIDLYYFHHGDFGAKGELLEAAAAVMDDLVREGKVRVKGQSAYSEADFERAVPVVRPAVLQSWAHALDPRFVRPGSRVSRLLEEHGMSFVAFSPLAQARLLDKFDPARPPSFEPGDNRRDNAAFGAEALAALKPKLARLKERFGETTEDLASVALRYVLEFPKVACVIPGFRNRRQVECNLAGGRRQLSEDDLRFIEATLQE
ncbi:MAG: aldo/keto reductase [Puniceicoccaceae bacterium]|nr:MAG: aldo/keto reductase [Puniceicoccaceae bacterium]